MNNPLATNTIYLIGIGGIGMSALARYFRQQGKEVSGYDRTQTPLTEQLETEGMNIHYRAHPAYVPCDVGLVIYTPAIPEDNRELSYVREIDVPVLKRAEVLGLIAAEYKSIAVAGTHGKTSISSMITHIMHHNERAVTGIIGGVMNNYDTNMLRNPKSKYLIAEADEYDRSFLRLNPEIAVVSAIAADHLDIYGTRDNMVNSFNEFIDQVNSSGMIFMNENVKEQLITNKPCSVYGFGSNTDTRIEDVRVVDHHFHFKLNIQGNSTGIKMLVPGIHNIENAAAAAGVCYHIGMDLKEIKGGLESYRGVKRRFEYILEEENIIFIDDYAHHPDEITACIDTARKLYPGKKISGVFQPHLYSRTRDFAEGFSQSLSALDELFMLDIYPARENPIEGVSSEMLLEKVNSENKILCTKEELPEKIRDSHPEVLLTMGAGDIDRLVKPIKEILTI